VAERRQDSGVLTAPRMDRRGRHKAIGRTVRRGRALRSLVRARPPVAIVRTRRRSALRLLTTTGDIRPRHEGTRLRGRIRLRAAAIRRRRVRIQLQAAVTLRRRRVLPLRRAAAPVAEVALAAVEVEVRMAEVPPHTAGRNFQANRAPAPTIGAGVFLPMNLSTRVFLICANSFV